MGSSSRVRSGWAFGAVARATATVVLWCGIAGLPSPALSGPTTADPMPLATAFGSGAHAFFACDYQRAYDELSNAIQAGTEDPRAWYFRGLAALRLGRVDEAEADFSAGAERESRGFGTWPVSRSLERVQGPDRLTLERHRARARVAMLQQRREAIERRYSGVDSVGDDVLRRRRPVERPDRGGADNPFEERGPAADGAERMPPPPPPEPGLNLGGEAPAAEPAVEAVEAVEGAAAGDQR